MSEYITTEKQLEKLAEELEGSKILAIDTEFLREKTYFAKLCLLQLNNGQVQALVDPLSVHDLSPLVPILTDKNCVKIFHAGSQDIEILTHETGVTPTPIFDTQIAASLLGYPLQVGYGPLVRSICDVKLPKADGFTDWSRRPLSNNQLKYALDDVVYLPHVYEVLNDELDKKGRRAWVQEDFDELADPNRYKVNPREAWHRVKRISSLSRGQLAIVREVAAWREKEAMRRDQPRKWIMADEAIVEIARKAPNTRERLFEVRGLARHLTNRDANAVLECVRKAKALPQSQWPRLQRHAHGEAEIDGALELMAALVEVRAKENEVAPPILASYDELSKLCHGHRDQVSVLEGWRYDMVGHELVDLLEGRLAIYLDKGHIEVAERATS
ncbi:MAG: ribonuclease D [Coriobacteriales bacterium]|jgi:ribonuclease D